MVTQRNRIVFGVWLLLALFGVAVSGAGSPDLGALPAGTGVGLSPAADGRADTGVPAPVQGVASARAAAVPVEGAPSPIRVGRVNLSSRVNAWVDNVMATALRLMDLPLFFVLAVSMAVLALPLLLLAWLLRGRASRRLLPLLCLAAAVAVGLTAADWRLTAMERRIRELQNRVAKQQGDLQSALATRRSGPRHLLFDREAAEENLRAAFGEVRLVASVYEEAADLVLIRIAAGPVHAFLAVVDLTHPDLEIRLDSAIGDKTLTSEFAKTNGCLIAVNGEAGNSPARDSGLGGWIGNFVSAGNVILLKDTDKRPFLAFDRRNRASYSPAREVVPSAPNAWYNVIWGRHDVLIYGAPAEAASGDRQPRTAMAIDGSGSRLYLLVVDGRQPGYSVGLTRRDAGRLLSAFGAGAGMLCDEGGSSCLYAAQAGGILNSPCDAGGKERPTYTHFGVALRPVPHGDRPAVSLK